MTASSTASSTVDVPVRTGDIVCTDFTAQPLDRTASVYIAGHRGLVGSALWRRFGAAGFTNLAGESSADLDLRDRDATFDYLRSTRPDVVVLAAAKVGGILANNSWPVDFLSDNLRIQLNVLDAAREVGVQRLLFLGSSCIYPKYAAQPIREEALLNGDLEPTNEAYAIAKIAGMQHVRSVRRQYGLPWISAMPTNLYGPGDNFADGASHVVPALIRRYENAMRTGAPSVLNWGSGTPRRELMYVDDMADACLHLLDHYNGDSHVNVGVGKDNSIREIAAMVADVVGYTGETHWDTGKPDGTPRKILDVTKIWASGWAPSTSLAEGLAQTVDWYRTTEEPIR